MLSPTSPGRGEQLKLPAGFIEEIDRLLSTQIWSGAHKPSHDPLLGPRMTEKHRYASDKLKAAGRGAGLMSPALNLALGSSKQSCEFYLPDGGQDAAEALHRVGRTLPQPPYMSVHCIAHQVAQLLGMNQYRVDGVKRPIWISLLYIPDRVDDDASEFRQGPGIEIILVKLVI
jgi:hypothetical protein